ncbi:hypothetical protein [Methylosoma difficile]
MKSHVAANTIELSVWMGEIPLAAIDQDGSWALFGIYFIEPGRVRVS